MDREGNDISDCKGNYLSQAIFDKKVDMSFADLFESEEPIELKKGAA